MRAPRWSEYAGTRARLVALVALGAVGATLLIVLGPPGWLDLQVYRLGGAAWLDGTPLYGVFFRAGTDEWLPFTYPPLAAVLFVPLAVLPLPAALALITALSLGALAFVAGVVADRLGWRPRAGMLVLGCAVAVALAFEPVRQTLWFGQLNLILMAMVTADCLLRRTPWPRGLLIGLAAAVKLTPAVFVLFFLPHRAWRPTANALAGFVGASLVGVMLAPDASRSYWLGALLDADRVGGAEYAGNQSLRGALRRLALPEVAETVAWLALVAAVVVAGWIGVRRLRRAGRDVEAMLVVAAVGLLCSPVSWSHHWVWVVPAMLVLAVALPRPAVALAMGALATVFLVGPHWLFPYGDGREWSQPGWQHIVVDSYVVVAVVVVVAALRRGAPGSFPFVGPAAGPSRLGRRDSVGRRVQALPNLDPPGTGQGLGRNRQG